MAETQFQGWQEKLLAACDPHLLFHSRVHRLPSFARKGLEVFVKREDESSFGMTGFKRRKYTSLLPFLEHQGFRQVVLIGGSRSNHVVALAQLLRERQINFHAFLKQGHEGVPQGNALLRKLLIKENEITWVPSDAWPTVLNMAQAFASQADCPTYVIPEGGSCPPALPGAATLMVDLLKNEQQLGFSFDHVFVDAGTAMVGGCLALMMGVAKHQAHLHIVSMADGAAFVHTQIEKMASWFKPYLGHRPSATARLQVHQPPTARAFGSVNRQVLDTCLRLARTEGLLVDPIYSGKLFLAAEHLLHHNEVQGKVLLIHSGGGTGLMGFGEKFAPLT